MIVGIMIMTMIGMINMIMIIMKTLIDGDLQYFQKVRAAICPHSPTYPHGELLSDIGQLKSHHAIIIRGMVAHHWWGSGGWESIKGGRGGI